MGERKNIASKIAVQRVEKGRPSRGCLSSAVEITLKESANIAGDPNMKYVGDLLKSRGYWVVEGTPLSEAVPFRRLCVSKQGEELLPEEVLAVLGADPEIDLFHVNKAPQDPG